MNCIGNAINFGCASKHLIKIFEAWPIRRCTNHVSFLLLGFILILHLVPLVMRLLPTLKQPWKMCIQLFCKIFPICFLERLLIVLLKNFFANIQKKLKLCIYSQPIFILLKSQMSQNNINWYGRRSMSLTVHEQIEKRVWCEGWGVHGH